jgi:hypothetical protein
MVDDPHSGQDRGTLARTDDSDDGRRFPDHRNAGEIANRIERQVRVQCAKNGVTRIGLTGASWPGRMPKAGEGRSGASPGERRAALPALFSCAVTAGSTAAVSGPYNQLNLFD